MERADFIRSVDVIGRSMERMDTACIFFTDGSCHITHTYTVEEKEGYVRYVEVHTREGSPKLEVPYHYIVRVEELRRGHNWSNMSDVWLRDAVRSICCSSATDEEIKSRLRRELGYPYDDVVIMSTSYQGVRASLVLFRGPRGNMLKA